VTRLLYESGCRYVNYAPESGSEAILERIKKRISKPKMLESMRGAVRNGINVKANFILGFPGERWRDVWCTYRFIVSMSFAGIQDISVFPFSPYPGSALFEFVKTRGDIVLNDSYFGAFRNTPIRATPSRIAKACRLSPCACCALSAWDLLLRQLLAASHAIRATRAHRIL